MNKAATWFKIGKGVALTLVLLLPAILVKACQGTPSSSLVVSRQETPPVVELHPYFSLWLAAHKETNLNQAMDAYHQGKFTTNHHLLTISDLLGNPRSYWLRFHIRNTDNPVEFWRLEFADTKVEDINLFTLKDGQLVDEQDASGSENGDEEEIVADARLFAYPSMNLHVPMGEERVFYAQIISQSPPLLNARLMNDTGYAEASFRGGRHHRNFYSLLGLMGIMALATLLLCRRWLGFGVLLTLGLGILRVTLRMEQIQPILDVLAMDESSWHLEGMITGLWILSTAWLVTAFLRHGRSWGRWDNAWLGLSLILALITVGNSFLQEPHTLTLSLMVLCLSAAILCYAASYMQQGLPYSRYVLIGILPTAVMAVQGMLAPGLQNLVGFGELPMLYSQAAFYAAILIGYGEQCINQFVQQGGFKRHHGIDHRPPLMDRSPIVAMEARGMTILIDDDHDTGVAPGIIIPLAHYESADQGQESRKIA